MYKINSSIKIDKINTNALEFINTKCIMLHHLQIEASWPLLSSRCKMVRNDEVFILEGIHMKVV